MIRRTFLATCCAGLLAVTASADAPKSCCAKAQVAGETSKMKCSITEKVVGKCCCVQREGKTYCTLADKAIDKCCFAPLKAEGPK